MSANIRFECLCDKNYRPINGEFVTRLALRLSISDLAETLPLNICLLLDKSMSMTGTKIEEACQSARRLIGALREGDRLSLISFSTTVETLLENQEMDESGKHKALQAVDRIQVGGITRMDLALAQAYTLLEQTGDTYLKQLLLLSDGAPTNHAGFVLEEDDRESVRQTMGQALQDASIITSVIGLGDAAECLAPFLEACAETGQGVFYHEQDPDQLADRFLEEFHRIKATAASEVRFRLNELAGRVRKAAAIYPDLRELSGETADGGSLDLDVGALQKGEEHVFILELVTPGLDEPAKKKLCDVSVEYHMEGEQQTQNGAPPILEYTDDETLLTKPGHTEVEKYKAMYMAFQQTRFAAANVRDGGDAKKTRQLLETAAKTTRRLGNAKQTKLLHAMADNLETAGTLSENDLAQMAGASRKTKVLST